MKAINFIFIHLNDDVLLFHLLRDLEDLIAWLHKLKTSQPLIQLRSYLTDWGFFNYLIRSPKEELQTLSSSRWTCLKMWNWTIFLSLHFICYFCLTYFPRPTFRDKREFWESRSRHAEHFTSTWSWGDEITESRRYIQIDIWCAGVRTNFRERTQSKETVQVSHC